MIRYTDNAGEIITVWKEAFGDTEGEIRFFIENLKRGKCLAYYEEDKIASLMYIVECSADGEDSNYIYAACTLKCCMGKGIMSALLEY
nr:GNAT family N-acetyltransferase [Eubacterium sp.]